MAFGIDDAIATGLKILDKFVPDPAEKAKAAAEFRDSMLQWDQGQMAVNAEEAKHQSVFVAGWRPFIGWICGWAFALNFVILPLLTIICGMFNYKFPAPALDWSVMMPVLLGILGLGGLRTYEKKEGIAGYR
jgi:hypothetical protein